MSQPLRLLPRCSTISSCTIGFVSTSSVCHEGHRGDCELYGSHTRSCVKDCCCGRLLLENNPLRVQRVICTECLHTHAILPGWLIPYRQYTVTFVLNVLLDYCERRTKGITIEEICEHYQITSNLLAQWLHEFKDDEKTWCAILGTAQRDLYSALNEIMTSRSDFLRYYFTHQPHDRERCFLHHPVLDVGVDIAPVIQPREVPEVSRFSRSRGSGKSCLGALRGYSALFAEILQKGKRKSQ